MPEPDRLPISATDRCDDCGRPLVGLADHAGCMAAEIYDEWRDRHALSPDAVHWLATHGQPGDPQPIASGIERLRRLDLRSAEPGSGDQPVADEGVSSAPVARRGA